VSGATSQEFDTVDRLRLEVARDWPGEPNLVPNPSGEFGSWGWVYTDPDEPGIFMSVVDGPAFRVLIGTAGTTTVTTDMIRVSVDGADVAPPGGGVTAVQLRYVAGADDLTLEVHNYDAAKAFISVSGPSAALDAPGVYTIGTGLPEDTAYVRLVIVATGPAANHIDFTDVALTTSASTPLITVEPEWLDILGSSLQVIVERPTLDVGTLNATLRDVALDPSQGSEIRKGKRVRLLALVDDGEPVETWEPIFTGELYAAKVTYDHLLHDDPDMRARIDLVAVDAASTLANTPRPDGYRYVSYLCALLDGAGVPWLADNDPSVFPGVIAPAARIDAATALDQVVLIRDSNLAYGWVSRRGVLVMVNPGVIDVTVAATFDEEFYTGLALEYDTEQAINFLPVAVLSLEGTDPVSTNFGPYVEDTSKREFGKHEKTLTVLGAWTDEEVADLATAVFTANAFPELRVNSVTAAVAKVTDFAPAGKVFRDLYDLVDVVNEIAGVEEASRITGISHSISPSKWLVTYELVGADRIARPQRLGEALLR
jgi:hypothetical protein